jgi:hypothetical protein
MEEVKQWEDPNLQTYPSENILTRTNQECEEKACSKHGRGGTFLHILIKVSEVPEITCANKRG